MNETRKLIIVKIDELKNEIEMEYILPTEALLNVATSNEEELARLEFKLEDM